ncbi:copper resistance protein CopC/CopD [Kineosporia sp. J2-2]|uniref:Copper resistance protein CopC/CopD n=1 Tax=Kineosporia corallincola TaxID=2835133 RepID=A0ABS5TE40_9ACTN|nr:copper resistance protein CopC [Kineosporia corallincola]MBT0768704.1 copper resistance protein CopC/CopD [Kineosporia corallincola]
MTIRAVRRPVVPLVLLVVLASLLPVLTATPAQAHAYVLAVDPADGSQLDTAPTRIQVTFSEAVTLPPATGAARVLDPSGADVTQHAPRLTDGGHVLVIALRPGLPEGVYIASWTVVSDDSHPVGGAVQFGYGVPATVAATPAGPTPTAGPSAGLQLLAGLTKGLLYLSLVAALGLRPAARVLDPAAAAPGIHTVTRVGAALAVAASLAQAGIQWLWEDSAVPDGLTPESLRAFAGTSYSITVLVRIGLLALLLARPPRHLATHVVLGAAVLATVVLNGHAGNGPPWRAVVTLVHVAAVVAWLGGLSLLAAQMLRRRLNDMGLQRLAFWSRYAATLVTLLAVTGLVQAVGQVRHPAALVSTTYGWILVLKLLLVAVAGTLAVAGHRWVRRTHHPVPPGQTARLRRRVRAEAATGAVIVVVSGALSSVTPASAAYAPHRTVTTEAGPYTVTVEIAPARRGPQGLRIVTRGRGTPVRSVVLELQHENDRLPITFPYRLPGPLRNGEPTTSTFVSASVNIPETGDWTAQLTLVAGPTRQYATAFTYTVV